jgi:hypothetical protein
MVHIRCIYSILGRDFTKYAAMHGVYIQLWPTLAITKAIHSCSTCVRPKGLEGRMKLSITS